MQARPLVIEKLMINVAFGPVAVMLATMLAGCAASAPPTPAQANLANLTKTENLPGKPGCFWKSSFQGDWTVLNDSTLIVHAPLPKDAYVIKLFEPVFSLSFKQGLGFEDKAHTGQICDNGDDYLLVPGWQPPAVPIVAVRALTTPEEAKLLQAAGLRLPTSHAATQPAAPKN